MLRENQNPPSEVTSWGIRFGSELQAGVGLGVRFECLASFDLKLDCGFVVPAVVAQLADPFLFAGLEDELELVRRFPALRLQRVVLLTVGDELDLDGAGDAVFVTDLNASTGIGARPLGDDGSALP